MTKRPLQGNETLAERYRWLRHNLTRITVSTVARIVGGEQVLEVESVKIRRTFRTADHDSVDRAIDAAMEREKEQQG